MKTNTSTEKLGLMEDLNTLSMVITHLEDSIVRLYEQLSPVMRDVGPAYQSDEVDDFCSEAETEVREANKRIVDINHSINLIEAMLSL